MIRDQYEIDPSFDPSERDPGLEMTTELLVMPWSAGNKKTQDARNFPLNRPHCLATGSSVRTGLVGSGVGKKD
jgi:hypothetical protein